jgi:hypothetical protein
MEKRVLILVLLVFCLGGVLAGEYYVSPSGSASWSGCKSSSGPYCSLDVANKNAVAGDVIYLTKGEYVNQQIDPLNSGSTGNYIIYKSYGSGDVAISGQGIHTPGSIYGGYTICRIMNKSYIWIEGIKFKDPISRFLHIEGSDHIVLKNNIMTGLTSKSSAYSKIAFLNSNYIYSEGNRYEGVDTSAEYDLIREKFVKYAVFYNDYFGIGTHDSFDEQNGLPESYHVFLNCEFEPVIHTGLGLGGGGTDSHGAYNLVQDCLFHNAGKNMDDSIYCVGNDHCDGLDPALYMRTDKSIVRNNQFFENNVHLLLRWTTWSGKPASSHGNRIYNNVFYNTTLISGTDAKLSYGAGTFVFSEGNGDNEYYDNFIFNNIFSESAKSERMAYWYNYNGNNQYIRDNMNSHNIWYDSDMDVVLNWGSTRDVTPNQLDVGNSQWSSNFMVNPGMVGPNNQDFSLKENSQAIDSGKEHTVATNGGSNSVSLKVKDSLVFFSVEAWGLGWHRNLNSNIKSDLIKIGSGEPVRIVNIDYSNNIITLDKSRSWSSGDKIYYCHNDKCFSGSSPDIGAYEFFSSGSDGPVIVEPYCGDGVCDSLESCLSCSADCGECEVEVGRKSYFAKRLSGAVLIDGEISEFRNANYVLLENSNGNFANCSFVYDSENLYVGCKVLDSQVNTFYTNRDENIYNDDSIEIVFDLGSEKSSSYDLNDYKIILSAGNVLLDSLGSSKSFNMNIESEVVLVSGGYVLEMSVPFSNLSSVGVNDSWGFDLKFNDLDGSGNIVTSMWSNLDGGSFNNPSGWGEVVFVEGVCVSFEDVALVISSWKSGGGSVNEILEVVGLWKRGC